nr:GerAB/ArcD/ProY family transporter [Texcoconibacillus texcoconensis]
MYHIQPQLVFFLVHTMQAGIGILSFQRQIAIEAGYQSWIAIIIAGLIVHGIIWLIYEILNADENRNHLPAIHKAYFGKWVGGMLTMVLLFYFFFMATAVLRTYIHIIQLWMFPKVTMTELAIPLLFVVGYAIYHGFRVVTGVAFFGFMIPIWLLFTNLAPLEFGETMNILPLFDTSVSEQIRAVETMTLSFIGFEAILFYYPFIQNGKASQKWAHFGHGVTVIAHFFVALTSFLFYSEPQLKKLLYPTLSMWKIIQLPIIERFEYVGIALWLIVIMPNLTIALWVFSRGFKQMTGMKQKHTLTIGLVLSYLSLLIIQTYDQTVWLTETVAKVGMMILGIYIPVLFVISKVKKKKGETS